MSAARQPSSPIEAVVFDVDGVLVDSLDAHLRICRDKSQEYGLALTIPDAAGLRAMVKRGIVISPMKQFFLAVGFPEDLADRADASYRREFVDKYRPQSFDGVGEMLAQLASHDVRLGMVTSNTLANVRPSLGSLMQYFDPKCLFARDEASAPGKPEALRRAAGAWSVPLDRLVYVGDQRQDFDAARDAGVRFLGVTYGWGIDGTDLDVPKVDTPREIASRIIVS
jgi:phosphoglycolate phosphatase-like HAD superfamily hydrolase